MFRRSAKNLKQMIKAMNKITGVFAVVYLLLVLMIFFSPLFRIGWLDRLFILLLSCGSFIYCLKAINDGLINPYLAGKRKYLLATLLCYSAFAAVGNHLFLDPVTLTKPLNCLIFIMVLIWVAPITISFLYLFEKLKEAATGRLKPETVNKNPFRVRLLFISIIMLVGVIYLIAYNPAIMSPDSFSQWHQASGLEPLVNWHPPFHTLLIRALITIMPSPSFVALVQIFFFALLFSAVMMLFYHKGVKLRLLIIMLFAFMLLPTNGIHLITIWKDVPYAITLLWLTLIILKVVISDYGEKKPLLLATELTVSLVFVYFFRQNGIIVYLIYACFISIYLVRNRTFKPLAGLLLSLVIIILIRYPLYSYLQVEPAPPGNKYIALVNDLAGVYFAGGNLTPEAELYLENVVDLEQLEPVYSEYRSNYDHYRPELDQTSMLQLLKIYGHTMVLNPLPMINSILCRLDLYWNITTGKGAYIGVLNFREISNWEQFPIHFYRKNNVLTAFFDLASKGTVYLSPALLLFWRFGIWLVLLFTGFLFALRHNLKIFIILAVPIMANLLSLALSSGWLDYRYGWSILITVPVIIGAMIMPWSRGEYDDLR